MTVAAALFGCQPPLEGGAAVSVRRDAAPGTPRGAELRLRVGFTGPPAPDAVLGLPVLVRVPEAVPADVAFRFVSADGAALPFEIERWGPVSERAVWVRAPRVSDGDFLWLVYGGAGPPSSFEPAAVWAPDYVGVWHFAEGPDAAATIVDSTANRLDGRCAGCGPRALDPAGGVGSHLVISPGFPAVVANTSLLRTPAVRQGLGVELWLNISQAGSQSMDVVSMMGNEVARSWDIAVESGGYACFRTSGNGATVAYTGKTSLAVGAWYHLTGTLQAGVASRLYLDGEPNDENPDGGVTLFDNGLSLVLGQQSDPRVDPFSGLLDELRISKVRRSPAWVKANYLSMTGALLTFSPPEPWVDAGSAGDGGGANSDGTIYFSSAGCSAGLAAPALAGLLLAWCRRPRRRA